MYVALWILLAAPSEKMAEVINRTRKEAKARIAKVSVLATAISFLKILSHYGEMISPTVIIFVVSSMQEQADVNIPLNYDIVKDAIDQMRGAVMIVYPMGLPPHDPVKQELENTEDLSGTQVRLKNSV